MRIGIATDQGIGCPASSAATLHYTVQPNTSH